MRTIVSLMSSTLCTVALLLSGCGGPEPPIGTRSTTPENSAIPANAVPHASWMDPNASGQDLLYVSGSSYDVKAPYGFANVYTYPSRHLVGTLTGFWQPLGECVDRASDVFIVTDGSATSYDGSHIYEFAHGGTNPIAVLNDPGFAYACSVDPITGNLAVANYGDHHNPNHKSDGDVAVYVSAAGKPVMYYNHDLAIVFSCAYDDQGNLYVAAIMKHQSVRLLRLAKGAQSLELLTLDKNIYVAFDFFPTVQWDGRYMTVSSPLGRGSQDTKVVSVYRLHIAGKSARAVGITRLKVRAEQHTGQTWIQGGTIIGVVNSQGYGAVSFWQYPGGGKPTHKIRMVVDRSKGYIWGATVSVATSR